MKLANDFEILTASSVDEVGVEAWDMLSAGRPFQSARWYRFGEQVMEGCRPIYIILIQRSLPVARATFWLVRDEPLPVSPFLRPLIHPVLHRWPLLICRSPLSNSSGLILPKSPLQEDALRVISESASKELRHLGASYLIFDYLEHDLSKWTGWPSQFGQMEVTGPGTWLDLRWDDFDDYLKSNTRFRIHQHYKRTCQEAANLGIHVVRQNSLEDLPGALELIHNVERRHESAPNPWAAAMLTHMHMVESTWLSAHIGNRLVGCMLLLMDNGAQIACLPGLTEDVPFAYFMLLYEAIQDALQNKMGSLHWGSGAYETKRRLGFELEKNNHIVFHGNGLMAGLVGRLAAS